MTEITKPFERYFNLDRYWAADERQGGHAPVDEADATSIDDRPISHRGLDTFERPFPALTPAQRLHMEVNGYVVIENVLTSAEVEQMLADIYEFKRRFDGGDDLADLRPAHIGRVTGSPVFEINNLPHVSPSFFDYVTHPRIIGMVEEVMGYPARPQQTEAYLHMAVGPGQREVYENTGAYQLHRGSLGMGGTIANGLYHFFNVKALTNLTDQGRDDGGTRVLAGSHKLRDLDTQVLKDVAMADPSLVHHVEAPAGSTLLFFESTMHASGPIRSGRDRVVAIAGYAPHMFASAAGYEPAAQLVRRLPEDYQRFFTGWYSYSGDALTARSLADHPPA